MSSLPDIDFARIRPYGQPASRSSAFEELASILIEQGVVEWPQETRFYRFGNPDGGREGKGVLPNGDVWAWQAKYLFEFDASAAGQVTSSVRRVLKLEPHLKRYFVAMPLDLPAGDTDNRTSASTRWAEKVSEWEAFARDGELKVEFVFIGLHQLVTALTEPRHAGRVRYWFGREILTADWQSHRLEEVIHKAGERYTPRLHVEVNTVQALDAVGRTDAYVERWQQVLAELRETRRWGWPAASDGTHAFADALPRCAASLDEADAALEQMISAAQSTAPLPPVETVIDVATETLLRVDDLLHKHSRTKGGYFVGDAALLYSKTRTALGAVRRAAELARSTTKRAAHEKLLVVTGRAGVGKTHLLCDVSVRRIEAGRSTVLILGQDFDQRSLLGQIGELTQLGDSVDDVFGILNAAAETAGSIGILMIDALNESERPERWCDDIRVLMSVAARYAHTALVVSCRSEFVDTVIGDTDAPTVEHVGFAEATDAAVRRFTQDFGLETPTFPVLNPEFSNPLFLKLTCEALSTLGETRFPFGTAGLVTVCDAFLEAVNKRLSGPSRGDYDERSDPVRRAVRELALLGRGPFERADVQRITEAALPGRSWSRSLMRGLIAEGVLIEVSDGKVTFGYQRLGDVTRAAAVAEETPAEIRSWLGRLEDNVWIERGVLSALATIVPERHQVELVDLAVDDEGLVSHDVIDAFVESLLLRAPESIHPRAVEIVQRLLSERQWMTEIWERLIRIACIPGHPLNAEWLHAHLSAYELADRDKWWSTWLVGSMDYDEDTAVRRLIEWAWPADLERRSAVSDDVAQLATQVLGWFLTTSDRKVRDRATKALVSIGEGAPSAFGKTLSAFRETNDPYVVERLAAAACGVALRTNDSAVTHSIAQGVSELVAQAWPEHLVTRDFVRRILSVARGGGWSGEERLPPYNSEWAAMPRSVEEIEALAAPPEYAYASIWHSLTGIMGDFGRYVMTPALRDLDANDKEELQREAERTVFDRVLELGWTPERFRNFDRGRSGGRDSAVERVGKKYQWIALYEVLGRLADRLPVKPAWADEPPKPYEYAEQLIWRDIDPTVLARKAIGPRGLERPWFSPVRARFPAAVAGDYPADMVSVPDPLDLIAVSDRAGSPWLVLASTPEWQQPLPPEIQALQAPRLHVWMQLHAYLVQAADVGTLREWATGKDWFGRWMPEIAEVHNVLLGAHPHAPEWSAANGDIDWWDVRAGGPKPADLVQCAAWYGGTGTSRDASAEEETRGYVPTAQLFDIIGVSNGVDFVWSDESGAALQDPSVLLGGPPTLTIRRDLMPRLADTGWTIFWTVLVGNELHTDPHTTPGDDYRWVTASASYVLDGDRVERVAARATRCKPGPTTERELEWVTREAEA